MATTYASFPPHRLHGSRRVSQSEALELISKYLEDATTDASLQPNALLTEAGPVSASQGATLGLILHNLQRVEAGLRGEHLAVEEDNAEGDDDAQENLIDNGVPNGDDERDAGAGEWQDKDEFEREQDVEQGELGERQAPVVEGPAGEADVPEIKTSMSQKEKNARKDAKKAKRKQEKRDKEEKRKKLKVSHD